MLCIILKNRNRMTTFRLLFAIFIFTTVESCTNVDKTLDSTVFYSDYKVDFLNSDLTKYNYNPRMQFTFPGNNNASYAVLILRDSSIRIIGTEEFSKSFNVRIDTFFKSDVILSKRSTNSYSLTSPNDDELSSYLIPKQLQSINIVDYYLNLENLLNKYKILEISGHPIVNTTKIVFSDHDYLIYKPDSLVIKASENKDFMKHLFENGKQLDKNWYQFNEKINTDNQ